VCGGVCMYIVHMCVGMYVCGCGDVRVCICVGMYVCLWGVCMYICVWGCMYGVRMYVCVWGCMYVCVNVYI
jgi:hypothetical protein